MADLQQLAWVWTGSRTRHLRRAGRARHTGGYEELG
jgi:hypothetical protein